MAPVASTTRTDRVLVIELTTGLAGVLGHVGGVPVEEMLGASPGALALATGWVAWLRAKRRRPAAPRER